MSKYKFQYGSSDDQLPQEQADTMDSTEFFNSYLNNLMQQNVQQNDNSSGDDNEKETDPEQYNNNEDDAYFKGLDALSQEEAGGDDNDEEYENQQALNKMYAKVDDYFNRKAEELEAQFIENEFYGSKEGQELIKRMYDPTDNSITPVKTEGGIVGLLKQLEGFAPIAKWDYQQASVGYGTKARYPGEKITEKEAEARLNTEASNAESEVKKLLKKPVTQNQLAALTSIAYNTGIGNAKYVIQRVNRGDDDNSIANYIRTFALSATDSKTKKVSYPEGLKNRRNKEANLYLTN
jgi:GH24 family phage-related lysozyme (muramidase)